MQRKGSAHWSGGLKDGKGTVSTASGVLNNSQYSFGTRFENGIGTNPEELIAAAHASCFSMASSHLAVNAKIPGADKAKFDEAAKAAETGCPISRVLNAKITMDAKLVA